MIAELDGVSKEFGRVVAVDTVSFSVAQGEVVGLLGANGAGKTTALRMLLGLILPTSGRVTLFGRTPDLESLRHVGYVPQGLGLYTDLTARENMRFQAGVYDVAVAPPPPDLAKWWDVIVERLPLGVRRRVAFEVALAHAPELLVLDEPTSGVGPLGRTRLWDTIRSHAEAGRGVLVTTHHLDEAEQCDRLLMMSAGRIVIQGTIAEVIGTRTAVIVTGEDRAAVVDAVERAGLSANLASDGVRIPGADPRQVGAALSAQGVVGKVRVVGATLEETFVAFSKP